MDTSMLKKSLARGGKAALSKIGAALSRADELGGEARDAIVEWSQTSDTAAKVRDVVARAKDRIASVRAARAAEPEAEADSVPVSDLKEPPTLGDPTIGVQVFGEQSCPWTGRALRLLEDRGIEHALTDLDGEGGEVLASQLMCETGHNTSPYIYVRGEFLGGFHALDELDRLGQLQARIEPDAGSGAGRVKIEVAKRPNTDEVAPGASSRTEDEAPVEPS